MNKFLSIQEAATVWEFLLKPFDVGKERKKSRLLIAHKAANVAMTSLNYPF